MIDVLLAQVAQLKKDKATLRTENKDLRKEIEELRIEIVDLAITIKNLNNKNKLLTANEEVQNDKIIKEYLLSKQ
jgi:uncharacterized protein YlxW (UPF0749 family)